VEPREACVSVSRSSVRKGNSARLDVPVDNLLYDVLGVARLCNPSIADYVGGGDLVPLTYVPTGVRHCCSLYPAVSS
jgi:hypothetical protein